MPKEITHWLIAERAAALLEGSALGDAAAANPNCLALGAVCQDILYYLPPTRRYGAYLGLANTLHGNGGEDSFEILRVIAQTAPSDSERGAWIAFLLGAASHIWADFVFHPPVVYLTGDYHASDSRKCSAVRQAHRRYETLVDLFFFRNRAHGRVFSVHRFLKELGVFPELLLSRIYGQLLQRAGASGGDDRRRDTAVSRCDQLDLVVHRALRNFSVLQGVGRRRLLSTWLCRLEPMLPTMIREVTALFTGRQLNRYLPELEGEIQYQHPVTGVPEAKSLEQLFETTVERTVRLCRRLAPAANVAESIDLDEAGPCLALGIPAGGELRATHFQVPPLRFH